MTLHQVKATFELICFEILSWYWWVEMNDWLLNLFNLFAIQKGPWLPNFDATASSVNSWLLILYFVFLWKKLLFELDKCIISMKKHAFSVDTYSWISTIPWGSEQSEWASLWTERVSKWIQQATEWPIKNAIVCD